MEALEEYLVEVRRGCTRLGIDYQLSAPATTSTPSCPSFCITAWTCGTSGGAAFIVSCGGREHAAANRSRSSPSDNET